MRITVSALGFLNLIVAAYGFIPNGPGRWGCAERKMTLLYQPKDVNELTDAASTLMSKLESLIDKLEQPEKQNEQGPDDIFLQDLSTTMSSKVQPQLMQVEHMIQSISSPSTDEYTVIDARRVLDAIDLHHAWRSLADCMESVPLPLGPPSTAHNINFLELPTASQLQEALKCALQDALSAPDADAQRAVYTVMGHLESYVVSFRHELDSLEAAASHHVAAAGTHAVEAVHDSTQAELEVTATATTATMDAVLEPPATAAEETVQSLEKSELDPAQANLLEQQLSQARQELEDFAEVSENPFLDPQPAAIDAEVTREEGSVYQLYDEAREELEDFTLQVNAHIGGESEEAIVVGDSVEGFVQAEKLVTANGAALPPSITAFTTNTPAASFGLENGIGDAGAATPQFTYGADDAIPLADAATPQAQFAYGQSGYDVEEVLDEAQIELEQFMSSALEEAPMPNEEAMSHPEEYEATHVDPVPQVETETTFVEPAAEQPEMRNESTQPDLNSVTQVQDDMPVSPDPPLQESASEQNAPYFVEEAPTDQSEPLVQVFEESVEQVLDEAHRDLEDFNIPTYSQPYDKTARADFSSPDENNIGGGTPDWVNTGPVKHEPAEDWFNPVPPNPAAPTAQQAADTAKKDFSAPLETNIGGGQPDWVGGGGSFGDEPDWVAEIQTSSFREEVDQAFASRNGVESHVLDKMDDIGAQHKPIPADPPLKKEPPMNAPRTKNQSSPPHQNAASTKPETPGPNLQANASPKRADKVHKEQKDVTTSASAKRKPIKQDKSKPQVSQLSKEGPVSNAPQGTKSSQNRRDPAAKAVQPKRPVGSSPSNSAKSKSAKPPRPQAQKKTETAKKIHLEVKEDFKTFSLEKAAVPKVSVEVVVPVAVPEVITEVEEKVSVKEVVDVEVLAERMLSAKNVWESFSPIKIQGGSRRSYFAHGVKRVQVLLKTDGTPLTANVEVWNGPDNVPQKINVFIEEGSERTFNVVVETPEDETSLSIKNTGPMGFPMWAAVVDDLGDDVIPGLVALAKSTNDVKRIDGESSNMYAFGPEVGSVAVLLKTNGRPLHARIELMQGANTNKQVMEVYTEDGITRPFLAVIETPGAGNVVRVVNTGSLEYPLEAFVEPYQSESESAVAKGWNTGGTCVWDTDLIV